MEERVSRTYQPQRLVVGASEPLVLHPGHVFFVVVVEAVCAAQPGAARLERLGKPGDKRGNVDRVEKATTYASVKKYSTRKYIR